MKEEWQRYTLHNDKGRCYLTFPALERYGSLRHLFTTRRGGDAC